MLGDHSSHKSYIFGEFVSHQLCVTEKIKRAHMIKGVIKINPGLRIRIGSGSRRAKMTHKSRNFFEKFMF
jgi:hypothetical protein